MAQFARPASDINNTGGYSPTSGATLWEMLDETIADDETTDVNSGNNPGESDGTGFEVALSTVSDPGVSTGHVLRVRGHKHVDGSRSVAAIYRLYQGTTPITSAINLAGGALSTAFVTKADTLSASEADAITDYSNLRVRVWGTTSGGGSPSQTGITWIEFEVPDAGDVTVSPTGSATTLESGTTAISGSASVSPTGAGAVSAVGTVTVSTGTDVVVTLTGIGVTMDTSSISPTGGALVGLTGSSATASSGTVGITGSAAVSLAGSALTSASGIVTVSTGENVVVALTGAGTTISSGSPAIAGSALTALTGNSLTSSRGVLSITGSSTLSLTGASSSFASGSLVFEEEPTALTLKNALAAVYVKVILRSKRQ